MVKDLLETFGLLAVLIALWVIIPILLVTGVIFITGIFIYLIVSEHNAEKKQNKEESEE